MSKQYEHTYNIYVQTMQQHFCVNNTNRCIISMLKQYEPMKNKFHMTTTIELWPMKFMMLNIRVNFAKIYPNIQHYKLHA